MCRRASNKGSNLPTQVPLENSGVCVSAWMFLQKNHLCSKVSSIHGQGQPTHCVVFDEIIQCRMYEVVSSEQTISLSAGHDKEMFKLHRRRIAPIRTAIRNHVAPNLITQPHQEGAVPFASQLVLGLAAANYACQHYTVPLDRRLLKIFLSALW